MTRLLSCIMMQDNVVPLLDNDLARFNEAALSCCYLQLCHLYQTLENVSGIDEGVPIREVL